VKVFPVGLLLQGYPCLVVGEDDEAVARATTLAKAGAQVTVVGRQAPEPQEPEPQEPEQASIHWLPRALSEQDLEGQWLVVQTRRDRQLATNLLEQARRRRFLFCAVDEPGCANFSHLAVAQLGELQLTVSSAGRAPGLARRLRDELARVLQQSGVVELFQTAVALRDATPGPQRRSVMAAFTRRVHFDGKLYLQPPAASEPPPPSSR
jgi:siroheme synthase-like protein